MAQQFLVLARAIHIRSVPEVHAKLDRAVQHAQRLIVICRPVGERHAHASEADLPDLAVTDPALFHAVVYGAQPPLSACDGVKTLDKQGVSSGRAVLRHTGGVLKAENLGKRYGARWLFRNVAFDL